MWAVEGLTHRYPTKVLAEVLPTCPQYCGHCTRMDLVGNPTPGDRQAQVHPGRATTGSTAMLDYLRATPAVRDVVVSGGDVANLPWPRLEAFVAALLEIDNIRDIRLATKALMGLPQHWLTDEVRAGMARLAPRRGSAACPSPIHTHVNAAQSVTPLVARAARAMLDTGIRDVRNQGVLLRGVNDSAEALLDLCFALLDGAGDHALLLLHVRHDPRQPSTGGCRWRRRRTCSTRSWATCPGSPRRGWSATCRTWASAGCTRCPGTTPNSASPTGRRTTGPRSRPTTRSR